MSSTIDLPQLSQWADLRSESSAWGRKEPEVARLKASSDLRNRIREREATTMFEIGPFVVDQESDHRGPQPQRCIKVLRTVVPQLLSPGGTGPGVHLTSVGEPDHCGEE